MLSNDIIEEVDGSRWISPVYIATHGPRLTTDLKRANKVIVREEYPMGKLSNLFTGLVGGQYFSKVDTRKAYWQIELTHRNRDVTTFAMYGRLFRLKRLPFGIRCASDALESLMNKITRGLKGIVRLQDDTAVVGKTKQEHDDHLCALLDRMRVWRYLRKKTNVYFQLIEYRFLAILSLAKG